MLVRVAVLVLAVAGLLAGGGRARAAEAPKAAESKVAESKVHFERGAAFAEQRDYEAAGREFETAYSLDGRKEALFAWAQVERLRGNCPRAIELYRKFLAAPELTDAQADVARRHVTGCERVIQEAAAAMPPPPPPPPVVQVAAPPAPPPPPPRVPRIIAGSLLVAAILSGATATTFYILSRADETAAQNAEQYPGYLDAIGQARSRQRIAIITGGAGVLMAGAALAVWLGPGTPERQVAAWFEPAGGGLAFRGRY